MGDRTVKKIYSEWDVLGQHVDSQLSPEPAGPDLAHTHELLNGSHSLLV